VPALAIDPAIETPPSRRDKRWTVDEALVELVRARLSLTGPTTAQELAAPLGVAEAGVDAALITLESEGVVLRGSFRTSHSAPRTPHSHSALGTPPSTLVVEWCDRRLLARIHRYTLNRLRAEIEPVSPADFTRFLFEWQHVAPRTKLTGSDGLLQAIRRLDGYELAAGAWERHVLPARVERYESSMLDLLCLTGQIGWARLSESEQPTRLGRATPVALFLREHATHWKHLAAAASERRAVPLSLEARSVLEALRSRGASFAHELAHGCGQPMETVHGAVAELVSAGLVTSDGFAGLRALMADAESAARTAQAAGRWSHIPADPAGDNQVIDEAAEQQARSLLARYGVVCRRLLMRETQAQPWRVLARVYRRLEARGEIRGGRFVSGLSGEQFALPEAVEALREVRRQPPDGAILVISAADPLNLAGILNAGDRVSAIASTRIAYRDGIPLAALEGDYMRPLGAIEPALAAEVASALAGRRVPPIISGFVGRVS
jgi:ATP-dependent Lhr-like helicase